MLREIVKPTRLKKNFKTFVIEFPKQQESLNLLHNIMEIICQLEKQRINFQKFFELKVVLSEIITNSIKHNKDSKSPVKITFYWNKTKFFVKIEDEGEPFDFNCESFYTSTIHNKLGLFLVKNLSDNIFYKSLNNKINLVLIEKKVFD